MQISQALENFLKKEFSQKDYEKFDDKQKTFLQRYSIDKGEGNTAPNQILKEVYTDRKNYGVGKFYTDNKHVEKATEELQRIHNRFKSLCDRIKKKKEFENPPFDGDFAAFLDWWCKKTEKPKGNEKFEASGENKIHGIRRCYYCGIEEAKSQAAFEKGFLQSKKFTGTLHIDKKDPDKGYNRDNCEFACALCNNAKSDIFSEKDFEESIAPAIKKYWNDCVLPQLEKKE